MTGPWPLGGLHLGVGGSHDHSDLSDAIIEANDTLLEQVVRISLLLFQFLALQNFDEVGFPKQF